MPLDHYVSRVHLKKFYSPSLRNRMYAISKKDLRAFTPNSEGVCGIHEGSTNSYLREDRAIEEFLETIEPDYNAAVEKLASNRIDAKCIYTIAGFVAYVISCSPGAMRFHSSVLQGMVEREAAVLDSQGLLPAPPPELGGLNLTEILKKGIAKVDIDPKFPQAIGIASILKNTAVFGNFRWEVLHNYTDDSPYFTSDYPVAIEITSPTSVRNKVVPLSPSLAIRIWPNLGINLAQPDFTFSNFEHRNKKLSRKEVEHINRLLVRCAEDLVFFRDNHPWVPGFVRKNRRFRIEYREPFQDIVETPASSYFR